MVFSRDISKGIYELGEEIMEKGLIEKLNVYAEDIQEDGSVLFLSIMNQNKKTLYQQFAQAGIFQDAYMWIKNHLDIHYPDRPISDYSYMAKTENVNKICRTIAAFGTGITDVQTVEVPVEKVFAHIPKQIQDILLADIEESDGTVRLLDLLRRDEIWFVNKRNSGKSDIYSLEEYSARFDQKIDKVYLEGRYGGIPVFHTVFPLRKA